MSYRDDLQKLREWCRKAEGRPPKKTPRNSLQGRKNAKAKRRLSIKRWLKWAKQHRKKWNAYQRRYIQAKRQQIKQLSACAA